MGGDDKARRTPRCSASRSSAHLCQLRRGRWVWLADHRQAVGTHAGVNGAALTIWRWGRQNAADLEPGRPLGSFEEWGAAIGEPNMAVCLLPSTEVAFEKEVQYERLFVLFQGMKHGKLGKRVAHFRQINV